MTTWTSSELSAIDESDEVELSVSRPDGSLGRVTVWVVARDDDVYVRSVGGRRGRWFRDAHSAREGHMRTGRLNKRVTFVEVDQSANLIDGAYQAKYGGRYSTIVPSIVAPAARSATLKLVPRD